MNQTDLYWIWLQMAVGQGTAVVPRLLKAFSTAEAVYRADRHELTRIGMTQRTRDALCDKSLDAAEQCAERTLRGNGWLLTPRSSQYPEDFRHLYSPPLVIYGKGYLPAPDHGPAIAVVGTRNCTPYGIKAAAAGCPVISGGARGVDRAAHEGALYAGGYTLAVQACGLDVEYPMVNRDLRRDILESGGALISEYPPGTPSMRSAFKVRNRLIAGLSRAVCVVEAPMLSGSLVTARLARDQGKDVFVVPGEITSPVSAGSHGLIREGAALVTSPEDILSDYSFDCDTVPDIAEAVIAQRAFYDYFDRTMAHSRSTDPLEEELPPQKTEFSGADLPAGLSEVCRRVYEVLGGTPISAERLFEITGAPLGEIFSALTELEIYGCIRSYPGQHYSR